MSLNRKLLVFVLVLVAAGASQAQVRVGVYGPMVGGSAQMGTSMRNGARLAVEQINASGGVLGKKIELVERDDEATPEKGIRAVHELLDKEKVVAVLGPINTAVADASVGYGNEKHVPVIVNVSTGAKVNELFAQTSENYVFRLAASDVVQAELIVRQAIDVRLHRKPAILCDDTGYGKSGLAKLVVALEKRGIKPVYVGSFKLKDTDMSGQLGAARAAGADVLLSYGIGPELAAVSLSTQKMGWPVEFLGSWTLGMEVYRKIAGAAAEGTTMPQTFIEASARTSRERTFIQEYETRFNEAPMVSAPSAAQGYDSVFLLKLAIEQAGTTDGPALKAALENLHKTYDGVTGKYMKPYSPYDHEAVKESHVLLGRVKNGRVVPSWAY
ncbi:MAG TPA: ABC transporter substrate-binding protein [Myxococcales bacterium]|jgi:branched-chain amino acid transport system substrate-binding protein|nr:ABC transporter substrate-binding protein [Myxococcales bacterium]